MEWLLVLTMSLPGDAPLHVPVGVMFDHDSCIVAGGGMQAVLQEANPGLVVAWTCLPAAGEDQA